MYQKTLGIVFNKYEYFGTLSCKHFYFLKTFCGENFHFRLMGRAPAYWARNLTWFRFRAHAHLILLRRNLPKSLKATYRRPPPGGSLSSSGRWITNISIKPNYKGVTRPAHEAHIRPPVCPAAVRRAPVLRKQACADVHLACRAGGARGPFIFFLSSRCINN